MVKVIFSINNNEEVLVLPMVPPDFGPDTAQNNDTFSGLSRDYNTIGTMGLWQMSWSGIFPVGHRYGFMPADAETDGWKCVNFFQRNRPRQLPFRIIMLDSSGVCRLNSPCTVDVNIVLDGFFLDFFLLRGRGFCCEHSAAYQNGQADHHCATNDR